MKKRISLLLAVFLCVFMYAANVFAANNSTFNQVITVGTLSTDILDASQNPVSSPSITLSSKAFSFSCYTAGTASTGTFGTSSERIYVINPGAANNGWTLDIAATGGTTTLWQNTGSTRNYDYNDPSGSGCTDGAGDIDTKGGQLGIGATAATLTADCGGTCTTTSISKGSFVQFEQGVTSSVNLLNAASGSDDNWRGYLTGAIVSQSIPAQQPADSYSINMTLTVTAS